MLARYKWGHVRKTIGVLENIKIFFTKIVIKFIIIQKIIHIKKGFTAHALYQRTVEWGSESHAGACAKASCWSQRLAAYNMAHLLMMDIASFLVIVVLSPMGKLWKSGLSAAADNPALSWLIFPLSANRPAPEVRNGYLVFPLPANRPAPEVWNEFRIDCVSPHDKHIAHLLFIVYTEREDYANVFWWNAYYRL